MKVFLRIAVVSLGLLLLSACASTQGTAYGDAPPKNETVTSDADSAYMAAIELDALKRGTRVMWIHPPQGKSSDR